MFLNEKEKVENFKLNIILFINRVLCWLFIEYTLYINKDIQKKMIFLSFSNSILVFNFFCLF